MTKWYLAAIAMAVTTMTAQARIDEKIQACESTEQIAEVLLASIDDVHGIDVSFQMKRSGANDAEWQEKVKAVAESVRKLGQENDNLEVVKTLLTDVFGAQTEGVDTRMTLNFIENVESEQVEAQDVELA